MGLTELFNEWIVERGSAKVQEKHIALFRDQLTFADKRISDLESEITRLKGEFKNSQTTIKQLTKENTELKQKINECEKSSHSEPSLDEAKVKILSFLATLSDEADANYIASRCSLSLQVTQFHLEELDALDMISSSLYINQGPRWFLAQEGRRYLITHGLL